MARPKSDIEPRILAAARARFLSDGVEGASLRRIARDAGTSIGMVYCHLASKDELFFGCVDELYGQLLAELELSISVDVAVRERIERLYGRVARLTEQELLVLRLVLREMLTSSDRSPRLRERFNGGQLARLVSDGYESGAFDRRLQPLVAMLFSGTSAAPPAAGEK